MWKRLRKACFGHLQRHLSDTPTPKTNTQQDFALKTAASSGSSMEEPPPTGPAAGPESTNVPHVKSEPVKTAPTSNPNASRASCPSYATKSVVGHRFTMEDSWQAVPDLLVLPRQWAAEQGEDQLPGSPKPANGTADAQPAATAADSSPEAKQDGAVCLSSNGADCVTSIEPVGQHTPPDTTPLHFFAVYDGHGGADVAKHCAKTLHEHLKKVVTHSLASPAPSGQLPHPEEPVPGPEEGEETPQLPKHADSLEAALKIAFLQVDQELAAERSAHEVGTTAVVSLLGLSHLWVANCGDSRALLCRDLEAVPLSLDHKATRSDEVTRVEQAGGYVWWDRVMGELAVSRAIGDHCLRPFVIAEPEVAYVQRRPEDQLLLMASDGLWDVFSNDEARKLALEKFRAELSKSSSSKLAVKKAASSLAKAALSKGSRDNITVIVVDVRLSTANMQPLRATLQSQAADDGSEGDD